MKKIYTFIFLTFSLSSFSQTHKVTLYDQLVAVNEQWKYQADVNPALKTTAATAKTEQQLIQFHLQETEKLLRKRSTSQLSLLQQKNRLANLNVLHSYMQQGIFPVNDGHEGRQPYFIDKYNTFCAVGYLMKQSNGEKMAREIHDSQNFSYLFDIYHPQLMEWVSTSGLSLPELALIQPAYGGEHQTTLMEFHYNNIGKDENEYIEILNNNYNYPSLDSIFFQTTAGVTYKKIGLPDMQYNIMDRIYYYTFPSEEDFADSGKIILRGLFSYYDIETIIYNRDSVMITDNPRWVIDGTPLTTPRVYYIGESENTPVGSSLSFCGKIYDTWNLQEITSTPGIFNPCATKPTPVVLASFNSTIKNNNVLLEWKIATETNNKYFDIERSADGTTFKSIGKVNGLNKDNQDYSFSDNTPKYLNYYRLKQVDKDGTVLYSKILFVKMPQANPVQVVYNGANMAKVTISSNDGKMLYMYDMYGRKMKQYTITSNTVNVSLSNVPAGKYLLQLHTNSGGVFNQILLKP